MWIWDQSQGKMYHAKEGREYTFVSRGYSGREWGKNNHSAQKVVGIGPIPEGMWTIEKPYHSKNTGPYTLGLSPVKGTKTFERSAFRIHGDSIKNPGTASHGCIILPRYIRERIWDSGDTVLEVIE